MVQCGADCEGCELSALLPLVEHACVDQLSLELHAYPHLWGSSSTSRARAPEAAEYAPFAAFFAALANTFVPFYGEYNPSCGPAVRCFEMSWRRRTPCA